MPFRPTKVAKEVLTKILQTLPPPTLYYDVTIFAVPKSMISFWPPPTWSHIAMSLNLTSGFIFNLALFFFGTLCIPLDDVDTVMNKTWPVRYSRHWGCYYHKKSIIWWNYGQHASQSRTTRHVTREHSGECCKSCQFVTIFISPVYSLRIAIVILLLHCLLCSADWFGLIETRYLIGRFLYN